MGKTKFECAYGGILRFVTALFLLMFVSAWAQAAPIQPSQLDFGDVPVNTTSSGNAVVTAIYPDSVTSVSIQGTGFSQTYVCSVNFNGDETCTVQVRFTPRAEGRYTGTLNVVITDTVTNGSTEYGVPLRGRGVAGHLSVSPTDVDFGTVPLNQKSSVYQVQVLNSGTGPIYFDGLQVSAPFIHEGNNCGQELLAGESCTIDVSFLPTVAGAASGTLDVKALDSDGSTVLSAQATLRGLGGASDFSVAPEILSFGMVAVGDSSSAQQVTVSNPGSLSIFLDAIQIQGPFSYTGNCGTSLSPGTSCTLDVVFSPVAAGDAQGRLDIEAHGEDGQTWGAQIGLSGTGGQAQLAVTPLQLDFGQVAVGVPSAIQVVSISNTGNARMALDTPQVTGPFSYTGNCPPDLDAGQSCQLEVVFTPLQAGVATGTLSISSANGRHASRSTAQVQLTGEGIRAQLEVTPEHLDFGKVQVGGESELKSVQIANTGKGELYLDGIQITRGPFELVNNHCGQILYGGSRCTVDIRFKPVASGQATGRLQVQGRDSDEKTPLDATVSLAGEGTALALSVAPEYLDFGEVILGVQSQTQHIDVRNTGSEPVVFTTIQATGDFRVQHDCSTRLEVGTSCRIEVVFSPQQQGVRQGTVQIEAADAYGNRALSYEVRLSGVGVQVQLMVEGAADFKDVLPQDTSPPQPVVITNASTVDLSITSIEVIGEFRLDENTDCGSQLLQGQKCTLLIVFAPTDAGTRQGELIIRGNQKFARTANAASTGFSVSIPLKGVTMNRDQAYELLNDDAFTAGNPNVMSVIEVIADTCASGRVKDSQLQLDCDALIAAAEANDPGVAQALEEITPERATKSSRLIQQGGQIQVGNVSSRIEALRSGATGFSTAGLAFQVGEQRISGAQLASLLSPGLKGGSAGENDPFFDSRWGGFVTGTLSFGNRNGSELDSGYDFDTQGITAGLDYRFSEQLVLGGALGYIKTDADLDNRGGRVEDTGYTLTAYGSYYLERFFLDGSLAYGWHSFEQRRRIAYTLVTQNVVVDQNAYADYDGNMLSVSLNSGYDFNQGGWTLGPRIKLDYIKSDVDGFRERMSDPNIDGGGWSADIEGTDQTWLTLSIGGRVSYAASQSWGVLLPYAQLDWLHEFKDDSQLIYGGWSEDPQSALFGLRNDDPDRDYFRANLGVSAVFKNGVVGFIDYDTLLSNDQWDRYTISAGVRVEF